MALRDLQKRIKKLNIDKIFYEALKSKEIQSLIHELITRRLFTKGEDNKGRRLHTDKGIFDGYGDYAFATYAIKREKSQRSTNVTLNDTGTFYNSIYVRVRTLTADILADFRNIYDNFEDTYNTEEKFENAIIGLSEEERCILVPFIVPRMQAIIRKQLGI